MAIDQNRPPRPPEPSRRPTDEQLADWAAEDGKYVFPSYYDDDHYEYLQGMFEELIERRAAQESMNQSMRGSGIPTDATDQRRP